MRPTYKYLLIGGSILLALILGTGFYANSQIEPTAKAYVENTLARKFGGDVELSRVGINLLAGPVITAHDVKLRHRGRTDVPPLIQFKKLTIRTSFRGLTSSPRKVHELEFQGLEITVPPKRDATGDVIAPPPPYQPAQARTNVPDFLIEQVKADDTVLKVLPRQSWREPLQWDLHKLKLQSVGLSKPMEYEATLRNAKPPGDIKTKGKFGPWNPDDAGQSFVEGEYEFRNADLSVFNGIAGMLSSDGKFTGALERLDVRGTTDTPDFRLDSSGNRVPLKTEFHAIVDGTSGDTLLEPVKAQLGSTWLYCQGGVTGKQGVKGKTVDLNVSVTRGKIDDILRLAVRSKPAMSGAMTMRARLVIPPGKRPIVDKMRLAGRFDMDRVSFSSPEIQAKINEMSQRARGKHEAEPERVASQFDGNFQIGEGVIKLDRMTFEVPGAMVLIAGSYGMRSEQIDMQGKLRMQARVSQTMRGWKSLLLKAADPFFAKDGAGAVIPISISGSRDQPKFGLNLRGKSDKDKPSEAKSEEVRARKKPA
ncbi:MAG TPA: AsmA-like C-terminal region-containing protein [Bryobacteraceae bacterium]|nr:AsmA-like C-terminal region-containing protein [Bryobacteraceae bacterium]